MASMAAPAPVDQRPGHKRNKSSSVLKSIIASKSHKRSPSDGLALNKQPDNHPYDPAGLFAQGAPLLPPNHTHSNQRSTTRDQIIPTNPSSPRKSHDAKGSPEKALHKKTKSSVSLRSLGREKDKDKTKEKQSREPSRVRGEDPMAAKPKKTKSTTNLAAMFSKNKQPKETKSTPGGDKENTTPPSSASAAGPVRTPIWAQFSSQAPLQEVTTTSKIPLNDRSSVEDASGFATQDYSPTKQRDFFDYGVPSLQKQSPVKQRPKSMMVSGNISSASILDTFSRQKSHERQPLSDTKGNGGRMKESDSSRSAPARRMLSSNNSDEATKEVAAKQESNATRRTNRVMAAVAALNGKAKRTDNRGTSPVRLDPKVVDAEFEVVLVSTLCPLHIQ
jgi:hypothetical protein